MARTVVQFPAQRTTRFTQAEWDTQRAYAESLGVEVSDVIRQALAEYFERAEYPVLTDAERRLT